MDNQSQRDCNFAGIVLCGGKSSRMGRPKADLTFGSETMLERVVGRLQTVVSPIVIVAAANQTIPPLDGDYLVVRDSLEYAGPLAGIANGLAALQQTSEQAHEQAPKSSTSREPRIPTAAYVTSCDVPFLQAELVQELLSRIEAYDIVVPFDEQYFHPLAAVYRTSLASQVADMLAAGQRRPRDLFQQVRTCQVPTDSLRDCDPELLSLINMNSPADYRAALQRAGHTVPTWVDATGDS